jgi:hypothetical protein
VTAGFGEDLRAAGPAVHSELLTRLVEALDRVRNLDLGGFHFMVGDGYGVDKLGNIWLDAADSALHWAG